MINYNTILYVFDPVQTIFNKSIDQNEISVEFPDRLRIEKRQIEYLNCEIVLTQFTGIKWNLITGLQPVPLMPGYLVGNKLLNNNGIFGVCKKGLKREMLLIHNDGLKGELYLYHFPGYDTKTAAQRIRSAKNFITFLEKK